MKKSLLFFALMAGVLFMADAQVSIKGGWAYAFDAEEGGLNLGGIYGITEDIDLAAGLTFYFPDGPADLNADYWMIDIDGHYNFPMGSGLNLYPLAGLNFTTGKVEGFDGNTEFGLNLGGGASFQIVDALSAYLELKYIIGDADQGVLGLGVAYRVN